MEPLHTHPPTPTHTQLRPPTQILIDDGTGNVQMEDLFEKIYDHFPQGVTGVHIQTLVGVVDYNYDEFEVILDTSLSLSMILK